MRRITLKNSMDGDRGPFPTYGHYARLLRNLLSNFVPDHTARIELDISKTPAFLFLDAEDNRIISPLYDGDQQGMCMFVDSCRALIDGPPIIAPFRRLLRWFRKGSYCADFTVFPDEETEPTFWRIYVIKDTVKFTRLFV